MGFHDNRQLRRQEEGGGVEQPGAGIYPVPTSTATNHEIEADSLETNPSQPWLETTHEACEPRGQLALTKVPHA